MPAERRVAIAAERLLRRGATLSSVERDRACAALSQTSPLIRDWARWTGAFTTAFTVSVLSLFGGLIAVIVQAPPALAFVCVLTGTVLLGIVAVRLWKIGWQALDMAVGAYLMWSPVE